jgi:hypothetical protein
MKFASDASKVSTEARSSTRSSPSNRATLCFPTNSWLILEGAPVFSLTVSSPPLTLSHGSVLLEGGSDTTSSQLLTFIIALCAFPEVQEKAQKEVDTFVGRDRVSLVLSTRLGTGTDGSLVFFEDAYV